MPDVNLLAVLAATVAAFIMSSTYHRKLAVVHGGDWLAKLPRVALIVSVWQ